MNKYNFKIKNRNSPDWQMEITEHGHTMIPEDIVSRLNDKELLLNQRETMQHEIDTLCNDVNELEKQNVKLIKFLIDDYITCKDGQHPRHRDLKIYLEQITGKSIEEVLKDYE